MIRRVGQSLWKRALNYVLMVALVFGSIVPFSTAPEREARVFRPYHQSLVPTWKGGQTVFAPADIPSTPGAVVAIPHTFVAQSPEYARASRLARIPQAPTVCLPRSPWGDATWNQITDKVEYAPFHKPTLMFYVGTIRAVAGGTPASLQSAMNAAVEGDIVQLTANVALPTRVTCPTRVDSGFVLVTTDQAGLLPAARTTPYDVPGAYRPSVAQLTAQRKITTSVNVGGNLYMAQGARGWHFRGMYLDSSLTGYNLQQQMSWQAVTQTNTSHQPQYLIWEQGYIDGGSRPGDSTITTTRGIMNHSEYWYITDSRFEYFWGVGADTYAVGGYNGLGKGLLANCTSDGGSMFFYWGGANTSMGNQQYFADIVIRHCWGERSAAQLSRVGGFVGNKNMLESKNSHRNVWEANRFIGHNAGGQIYDYTIGPKPQNSTEQAWVKCHDIWVRHNYVTAGHGPAGCANAPTGTGFSAGALGTNRIEFLNNLAHSPYNNVYSNTIIVAYGSTTRTIGTFVVRNNTFQMQMNKYVDLSVDASRTNANPDTRVTDNVFFRTASPSFYFSFGSSGSGAVVDAAALDVAAGAGNWTVRSNLGNMTNKATSAAVWGAVLAGAPHNNRSINRNTMIFAKDTGGGAEDYTLAETGIYQTMSTSGGRPGVNMTLLNQALSGVAA